MMEPWQEERDKAIRLAVFLGIESLTTFEALKYLDVPNSLTYLSNMLLMLDGARRLAVAHCTPEVLKQVADAEKAAVDAFQACLVANGSKPVDPNMVCGIGDPAP